MARGKFITLEGGEGAGKSTQAKRLAEFLRHQGLSVILTREVGGTPGGEKIRKIWLEEGEGFWDPLSDLLLVYAARREHLQKVIWPALKSGAWVVCDRFMDSTRVYQGIDKKLPMAQIERLYKEIAGDFEPDLTLLLDVPVPISMQRVKKRGGWSDRYQLKEKSFHIKLRSGYAALAKKFRKRFAVVNAGQVLDEVAGDIEKVIRKRFGIKQK